MIGVSVDNGVISLENDVMDIHRTIIVMRIGPPENPTVMHRNVHNGTTAGEQRYYRY